MKRYPIYLSVFFFAFNGSIKAQTNLVPNPSFESYTICPNSTAQLNCTGNWVFGQGSTDYFNSCETTNFVSVPSNLHGFQNAYDGNAYVGMYNYDRVVKTYREPAHTSLIQPLLIGQKYHVSFKTVLTIDSNASCCAINKIGALFSTIPFSTSNPAPIHNFAHVYTDSIINDTLNWKTIYGTFIADSSYTYITIGNFFDSLNIQVIDYLNNFPASTAAYYFVDDIRVSTDSLFTITTLPKISQEVELLVYPNPANNHIFLKSDIWLQSIKLYDIFGSLVTDEKADNGYEAVIDTRVLAKGIYYIRINDQDSFSKKIIIH